MKALALAATLLVSATARAGPTAGIGVDAELGSPVAADVALRHPGGAELRLADELDGQRPVILVLAYVRCPMLCNLVLDGLASAVRKLEREPGADFRIVTVSLDPGEKASEAIAKKRELLARIGREGDADAWHYLLAHEPEVKKLADSLGFRYRWDARTEQFAHPAVIYVLTGGGQISATLVGLEPTPEQLGAALDTAAAGGATDPRNAAVLSCFRFDPALRRYRERIHVYFQVGALLVFLALGGTIGGLLWRETRRRRRR